jgi:hypothetical protein
MSVNKKIFKLDKNKVVRTKVSVTKDFFRNMDKIEYSYMLDNGEVQKVEYLGNDTTWYKLPEFKRCSILECQLLASVQNSHKEKQSESNV